MSDYKTSSNTVLVSVLAGVAGAAVALLFAPRSGEETRERLQQKTDDMKEQAKDSFYSAKETAGSKLENAKDLKNRLTEAARKSGSTAKQELKEELDNQTDQSDNSSRRSPVLNNWEEEV